MSRISDKQIPAADCDQAAFDSQQSEIYQRLGIELIALIPEHWCSAVLEFMATQGAAAQSIWSDEGHLDRIDPSAELLVHGYALERLLDTHRRKWKNVRFHIRMRPDESWSFGADYET